MNASDLKEWTTVMVTPVGHLQIVVTNVGVRGIKPKESSKTHIVSDEEHPLLKKVKTQLQEYFDGRRQRFDLPLDLRGTEFQLAAWKALVLVPYGHTATYGQQAQRIQRPTAVRAIGAANGRNPVPIVLPCHRIIGANGSLTGFAWGLDVKTWLLHHEHSVRTTSGH